MASLFPTQLFGPIYPKVSASHGVSELSSQLTCQKREKCPAIKNKPRFRCPPLGNEVIWPDKRVVTSVHAIPRHSYRHATRNPDTVHDDSFRGCCPTGVVCDGIIQAHRLVDYCFEQLELAEITACEFAGNGLSED